MGYGGCGIVWYGMVLCGCECGWLCSVLADFSEDRGVEFVIGVGKEGGMMDF